VKKQGEKKGERVSKEKKEVEEIEEERGKKRKQQARKRGTTERKGRHDRPDVVEREKKN